MTTTQDKLQQVRWPLVVGLGVLALVRPVLNIFGVLDDVKPAGPLVATAVITLVWIGAVVLARAPQPVLTLVLAGATYAVLAIALSGIVSPIKDGELQGPLANPVGIVGVLAVNCLWGLLAGTIAGALQRATGREAPRTDLHSASGGSGGDRPA